MGWFWVNDKGKISRNILFTVFFAVQALLLPSLKRRNFIYKFRVYYFPVSNDTHSTPSPSIGL